MALEKFSPKTIISIQNGLVRARLDRAIDVCRTDCDERPTMKAPRVITLRISLSPVADAGKLDSVDVEFEVNETIPKAKTRKYSMHADRRSGDLLWNEVSPDDSRQMTMDGEDAEDETSTETKKEEPKKGPRKVSNA